MRYNILKNKDRGFTLLEMIVSLGIFSLVAVIAVGSLVRITGLNRRAQSLQSAMDNVSFALESMTRDMRYGSSYNCINGNNWSGESTPADLCTNGSKGVIFASAKTKARTLPAQGSCSLLHAYWFDEYAQNKWGIKKSEQATCGGNISLATAISIMDEKNITITGIDFDVLKPGGSNPDKYSLATFTIEGYAGVKNKEDTKFTIKTAVSQRIAD